MKKVAAIALAASALFLAGCGEEAGIGANIPSAEEIQNEGTWVLETTPDGVQVWCKYFAEDGYQRSWQVYTCVPAATPVSDEG